MHPKTITQIITFIKKRTLHIFNEYYYHYPEGTHLYSYLQDQDLSPQLVKSREKFNGYASLETPPRRNERVLEGMKAITEVGTLHLLTLVNVCNPIYKE